MTPPSIPPDAGDRRGSDGTPPYGRRRDDEHAQQMLEEMRRLHSDVVRVGDAVSSAATQAARAADTAAKKPAVSGRRILGLAAIVGAITVIGTAVVNAVIWFGGGINGPGEQLRDFQRAQFLRDSLASQERSEVIAAVESMNGTIARFSYDVCTSVHKKPERECFDAYITAAARKVVPYRSATP